MRSAFLHEGPARELVHTLKYRGIHQAAALLAPAMRPLVGRDASCLVPVPRVLFKRVRLGIDPALELARALAALTGLEVLCALEAPLVSMGHAGRPRRERRAPAFSGLRSLPGGAVIIDDVVTTGSTLLAAFGEFPGVDLSALTATSVPR